MLCFLKRPASAPSQAVLCHVARSPAAARVARTAFVGLWAQTILAAMATVPLKEADIADASFIDELEQGGFVERLYTGDRG